MITKIRVTEDSLFVFPVVPNAKPLDILKQIDCSVYVVSQVLISNFELLYDIIFNVFIVLRVFANFIKHDTCYYNAYHDDLTTSTFFCSAKRKV